MLSRWLDGAEVLLVLLCTGESVCVVNLTTWLYWQLRLKL